MIKKTKNKNTSIYPKDYPIAEWDNKSVSDKKTFSLLAIGDIGVSGNIRRLLSQSSEPANIFGQIPKIFNEADLVVGNLETPLLKNCKPNDLFCGEIDSSKTLQNIGIDILSLASNHMYDFGPGGLSDTINSLQFSGIDIIGANFQEEKTKSLLIKELNGTRVGFLACGHTKIKQDSNGPFLWELERSQIIDKVNQSRNEVDILIVSIHWGPMLVDYPYPNQYNLSHELIDLGASCIIMHHAHILQPVEIYNNKPICYNLGNFIFDPDEGDYQNKLGDRFKQVKEFEQISSCLMLFEWSGKIFKGIKCIPFMLPSSKKKNSQNCLSWPNNEHSNKIIDRLVHISKVLNDDYLNEYNKQMWSIRLREIKINLSRIFVNGELDRILYLMKVFQFKMLIHLFMYGFKKLIPFNSK